MGELVQEGLFERACSEQLFSRAWSAGLGQEGLLRRACSGELVQEGLFRRACSEGLVPEGLLRRACSAGLVQEGLFRKACSEGRTSWSESSLRTPGCMLTMPNFFHQPLPLGS